jgi:hypothetical protein
MHSSLSKSEVIRTTAEQIESARGPSLAQFHFGGAAHATWLSTIVIGFMAVVLIALFWFPVRRAFANVEVNYNEGWNAYKAAMVASGLPLYGSPPKSLTGGAYSPLSFHLIAALGKSATFNSVGRGLSLISLLTIGIFVALIVKGESGSRTAAIFSFLLYEITIALLLPDRIGMNDPELLAEALSIGGLYFYLRNPLAPRFLSASALLFCLAGFTKQTLIVFPAVVAIDLLFRSRKALVAWLGAMLLFGGLLTAMTFVIDGRYFLLHLTGKRAYSYSMAWSQFHKYATLFQGLLVIATAWSISAVRSRPLFVWAFVLSNALAFLLAGGAGIDLNIFFSALVTTVIACGFALSDTQFALAGRWSDAWNTTAALMVSILVFDIMLFVPGQLRRDREKMRNLSALEDEFRSSVEYVKAHPGPALCESLLLCYEAGKPFEYEPFSVRDEIDTGRLKDDEVSQLLRTHHFQTVEISLRTDEQDLNDANLRASLTNDQRDPDKLRRFTPAFMRELLADYQLSKRTSQMALFCPR